MTRRWGMAIDLDKCTGCGQCAISCAQENNMPIFTDDSDIPKRVAFLDLMKATNDRDAKYPNVEIAFIPKMCQQCEGNDPSNPKPPCVTVCPVVATDVGDDGVESQVWSRYPALMKHGHSTGGSPVMKEPLKNRSIQMFRSLLAELL